jgi:predicted membrane metal-binding protein
MTAVLLIIAWFIGLWLAAQVNVLVTIWLLIGSACLMAAGLAGRYPRWRLVLACACLLAWGAARYTTAIPVIDASHIAYYNNSRDITLTGLVVDEPDVRDRFINLRVAVDTAVFSDGTTLPVTGQILVTTFRFPEVPYGTVVALNGRLETPPENEEFSYKNYLARQGVHSLMALPSLTVLAENQGNPLYQAIFSLKSRAQNTITRLIPDPQASLLRGILLGNDNGLSPELANDFRTTGMTHIIAISGEIATTLLPQSGSGLCLTFGKFDHQDTSMIISKVQTITWSHYACSAFSLAYANSTGTRRPFAPMGRNG